MTTGTVLEPYKSILEKWPKEAGPKPKKDHLRLIHEAGIAKPGSKTAIAVAMALRETGTTQKQIKMVLGAPYRNKLTALVTSKQAVRAHVPGGRSAVYKLTLVA